MTPESVIDERMSVFAMSTGAEIADAANHIDIANLVDAYFGAFPPFEPSGPKKNEFPDALALHTLEAWATKNSTIVLVVTKDNGWKSFCNNSDRLIALDDLSLALKAFQKEAGDYACRQLTEQVKSGDPLGLIDKIEQAIRAQRSKIEFIPEARSRYRYSIDKLDVSFTDITVLWLVNESLLWPIDYGEELLVAEATVHIDAQLVCVFALSSIDDAAGETPQFRRAESLVNHSITVGVLVTFKGKIPADSRITEIEVLARQVRTNFGEIYPDSG